MKLAINGGKKIRTVPMPDQESYGSEEIGAIKSFLDNKGLLSNYRGNWIKEFWGGPEVRAFEEEWSEHFNFKYSLAVNSCTSALQLACMAIGLEKGDEVIVTPWSMSCSATAPMVCGATPVFADIEHNQFCLCYNSVEEKITDKTKAIIAVSLFGSPIDPKIYDLAKAKNIMIIEDCAQAPGAYYKLEEYKLELMEEKQTIYTGNRADISCFSFTQGKHISSGEGGMISTNNYDLAMKCALLRNHSEAVINAIPFDNLKNIIKKEVEFLKQPGYNMRMTEIQAIIMREQLKKLSRFINNKQNNANAIYSNIKDIIFIDKPKMREGINHAYYVQPFLFDEKKAGIKRDVFINAVQAELTGEKSRPDRPMLGGGYIKPLYMMPIFSKDLSLPVVDKLYYHDFFLSMFHNLPLEKHNINDVVNAFNKVAENIDELKKTKKYWRTV